MNQMQTPGQMPGQAPAQGIQQVLPGMQGPQGGPPQAPSGINAAMLSRMSPQELEQLEQNPSALFRSNISLYQIIAAKAQAIKKAQMDAANQRQQAMAAGAAPQTTVKQDIDNQFAQVMAPQEPVMAAYGGEMHGYAGGGAVAFEEGGRVQHFADGAKEYGVQSNPEIERILRKSPMMRTPEENEKLRAAGVALTRRQPAPEGSGVDTVNRYLKGIFGDPTPVSYSSGIDEVLAAEKARTPTAMTAQQMEAAIQPAPAAAPRPPGATRPGPGTGIAQGQNRPQTGPVSATPSLGFGKSGIADLDIGPAAAPDPFSQLEADARAQSEGLQGLYRAQAQVDPRIVAARREAADFAQRSIADREKRATGALEAAGMPLSQGLINNQEALLRIAGAFGSGKRFADSAALAAREAGGIRGEQRKAFETAQREDRLERNALDALRQAQLELKVAQETGDVQGERTAKIKEEEAKANLLLTRMNILKERGTQEDRAEQRRLTARGQDLQRLSAQEQIAATLKAASIRGTGELTEAQRASLREKAADNVRQDKNLPLLIQNAKIEAQKTGKTFDQQTFIDALIQREYNRMIGKETPTVPTAGGIDPNILKLFKVTPVGG